MTAMIRNLAKMSTLELITGEHPDNNIWVDRVVSDLTNTEKLKAAGVHPMHILLAKSVYAAGHGMRGKLSFDTNPKILEALEKSFIMAFKNVKPTGKRFCMALDVSGSMSQRVAGTLLPCYDAEVGMCMVSLRTEPKTDVVAFSGYITHLKVNGETSFEDFRETIYGMDFQQTDCALPMIWAKDNKKEYDVFIVYTDNETYFGDIHPYETLKQCKFPFFLIDP